MLDMPVFSRADTYKQCLPLQVEAWSLAEHALSREIATAHRNKLLCDLLYIRYPFPFCGHYLCYHANASTLSRTVIRSKCLDGPDGPKLYSAVRTEQQVPSRQE